MTKLDDLEATDPGRSIVGLGGPQTPRPLRALNAFLDRLDTGEPPVPAERRILAALGPRKLALARDRCAGAVPLLVTPTYTADARRILGQDSTLVVDQMVVLDTNPTTARETARGPLQFLLGGGVGGYPENVLRMGFSGEDLAELGDRLVDELVTWGDADAIAARIGAPPGRRGPGHPRRPPRRRPTPPDRRGARARQPTHPLNPRHGTSGARHRPDFRR